MCKFYQGKEDKALENKLKKMFKRVCREKPESSRSVSAVRIPPRGSIHQSAFVAGWKSLPSGARGLDADTNIY